MLQSSGEAAMTRWLLIGVAVMFALMLASTVAWWNDRQEMQATRAANISLRQTLGDLTHAITEKDREIDRLARPCNPDEKSHVDRLVGR